MKIAELKINKIAVWNTAFLGDAILTLPLIQSLRLAYPGASLHFYTRKGFAVLFREHPALQEVYEYDKSTGAVSRSGFAELLDFGRTLKNRKYDLWVSCHRSLRSAFLARAAAAPCRIGYSGSYKSLWFSRFFYTHLVDRRFSGLDEIERLLQLLKPLRLKELSSWPNLRLPEAALRKAGQLLGITDGAQGRKAIAGLHPGSVWATKRWPVEYFARIGVQAVQRGARVAIFAGPGEEPMADRLEVLIRQSLGQGNPDSSAVRNPVLNPVINLAGALSLTELAACISLLDCYVSNDSGPMHLAWAQRVPLVALFGPTVPALGFAPRGENSVLLEQADLPCRPCGLHGSAECKFKHHRCMRDLTPDKVWPEVVKRLFPATLL
ncbi:MAG: glycosyltransferase family 9 protein [Deltaproteobacteria bacterium]|jgi:heptosyltransferase-2|nr:glycosyltransferase family 9 protein [Deltaproteobacteria bacterium]